MIHTLDTWRVALFSAAPAMALGAALLLAQVTQAAWSASPVKASKAAQSKPAPQPAAPARPPGDPGLGKDKADAERCIECHGVIGQGADHPQGTEAKFARLAGQKMPYIVKQVQDFRSGARKHDQMAIVARNVSDEDLADIAAWFSSLPPMKGEGADVHDAGRNLFEHGDPARGVPSCASCHGAKGLGQGGVPAAPRLAGQAWRYLDKQLRAWRDGSRKNDPDGVMNQLAKVLSDRDIDDIANHLSVQGQ